MASDSEDDRLRTDETKVNIPKTPTAHAPIDIGSQNLKVRIMFRNRLGTPRSAMSSSPHAATSGSDEQVADPGDACGRGRRRSCRRWRR